MELGFIGTGAITAAIVTGLGAEFAAEGHIHLSPRSADVAATLAGRFDHVRVAASNQDVLDRSDVVMLAVRPQVAVEVLRSLAFRASHRVISLIATYPAEFLATLVSPAGHLSKAVPLPSAALRRSPTAIYPPDPVAAALFGRIGVAMQVDGAGQFDALSTATATMASYFRFAGTIAGWLSQHGVPPAESTRYVAAIFDGLALTAGTSGAPDLDALSRDHATAGGINEQLERHLTQTGAFDAIHAGLDAILARIQAPRADPEK